MAATLTSTGVNFSDGSTINGTVNNTIGSYSFLGRMSGTGTLNIGSTVAGSSLRPAGSTLTSVVSWPVAISVGTMSGAGQNTTMSGTWRCMGYIFTGDSGCTGYGGATMFVRIS
jgi:hypothetical protein